MPYALGEVDNLDLNAHIMKSVEDGHHLKDDKYIQETWFLQCRRHAPPLGSPRGGERSP